MRVLTIHITFISWLKVLYHSAKQDNHLCFFVISTALRMNVRNLLQSKMVIKSQKRTWVEFVDGLRARGLTVSYRFAK